MSESGKPLDIAAVCEEAALCWQDAIEILAPECDIPEHWEGAINSKCECPGLTLAARLRRAAERVRELQAERDRLKEALERKGEGR